MLPATCSARWTAGRRRGFDGALAAELEPGDGFGDPLASPSGDDGNPLPPVNVSIDTFAELSEDNFTAIGTSAGGSTANPAEGSGSSANSGAASPAPASLLDEDLLDALLAFDPEDFFADAVPAGGGSSAGSGVKAGEAGHTGDTGPPSPDLPAPRPRASIVPLSADSNGVSREDAFYHVAEPTAFTAEKQGGSASTRHVDWFWGVERWAGGAWDTANLFKAAKEDPSEQVAWGPAVGDALYLGYTDKFREINIDLATARSGGTHVLEYVTAVDANGNPTSWGQIATISDTTKVSGTSLKQTGTLIFDPPASWKAASVNGSARLFYVRFRTTAAFTTTPVADSILSRDFVEGDKYSADGDDGIIPAFDSSVDANGDGYLNDTEFNNPARDPAMRARFLYESRMIIIGQMRLIANPSNNNYRAWAADYHKRLLELSAHAYADGIFMDNSSTNTDVNSTYVLETFDQQTFSADYASMLNKVARAIATVTGPMTKWILPNIGESSDNAEPVVQSVGAYFTEWELRALARNTNWFLKTADRVYDRSQFSPAPGVAVIDTMSERSDMDEPLSRSDSRTLLTTLAAYYTIANASTFLDFWGGEKPSSTWAEHWADAVARDVGQPVSGDTGRPVHRDGANTIGLIDSGDDPSNSNLHYSVFRREFTNALVFYKPLPTGSGTPLLDDTTATDVLSADFLPAGTGYHWEMLNADNTLEGIAITALLVSEGNGIRNGEGIILIKVPDGGGFSALLADQPADATGEDTTNEPSQRVQATTFSEEPWRAASSSGDVDQPSVNALIVYFLTLNEPVEWPDTGYQEEALTPSTCANAPPPAASGDNQRDTDYQPKTSTPASTMKLVSEAPPAEIIAGEDSLSEDVFKDVLV